MHKLLLVSVFGRINEDSNDRVNSLHDYLSFDLKIVTTDFSHRDKNYRPKNSLRNVDYLHVISYNKNLSLGRILSHWSFACRLFFYLLKNGSKYDLLYCVTPTPSSAFICAIYKMFKPHKIFVVDVIDVWPESLVPLGKGYSLLRPLFKIWKYLSAFAYKRADAIIAATEQYRSQAVQSNKKAFTSCYPLGIDFEKIQSLKLAGVSGISKFEGELWIAYAGNLGSSYDFQSMIDAFEHVCKIDHPYQLKFVIIGGGDKESELKKILDEKKLNYLITGNLSYSDYLQVLGKCDIGLNIFAEKTKVVQSYKFNDYLASYLFIINNLAGETGEIIAENGIGYNLVKSNSELSLALGNVVLNWPSIQKKREVYDRIIETRLSKKVIYGQLSKDLEGLYFTKAKM